MIFDLEKLEAEIKKISYDVQPTVEFVIAELERCKDPRYYYNNYWTVDGKAVKPLSKEEWDIRMNPPNYKLRGYYGKRL